MREGCQTQQIKEATQGTGVERSDGMEGLVGPELREGREKHFLKGDAG